MKRLFDFILALGDLLMPRECLVCGRRLGLRERHLCLSCAADVPYTRFWLAAHNPLADRFNAVLERHRGTGPMDYAYAVALLYYKGAYRAIPRALKYHGDLAAGRHYGALLGRRLAAAPHFADIDLVIPVPLHWTRLRSRGYNQAEILARALVDAFRAAPAAGVPVAASVSALADTVKRKPVGAGHDEKSALSIPHPFPDTVGISTTPGALSTVIPGLTRNLPEVRTDLLVRARRTRTQTRVSLDQKAQNVASAFQVPERFSPWARFRSRWTRLSARWPIGVGHDDGHSSRMDLSRHSGLDHSHHSGLDLSHRSEPDQTLHSGLDHSRRSELDHTRHSELDQTRHSGLDHSLHSGLDPESPAAVLASARHILLVDDTFTTGATLYACYAALRPYTTARISIATLAAVEGNPSAGP